MKRTKESTMNVGRENYLTKEQAIERMEEINKKHYDNIENRKNALNILIGAIPVGDKIFAIIPLEKLHIDTSYQRSVQSHVKTIAREWNPKKCDALKINYREDGNFYVWDGQHRKAAAELREIKYLMCDISVGLTVEEEAQLFGAQGKGIKKPNPYDIFKANVCANKTVDVQIYNMCKKYGLNVSKNARIAGNLSCLTLTRTIFERNEGDLFEWILELLDEAKWNELPGGHCHKVINSLYEIRKKYDINYALIQRKLVGFLEKTNPKELFMKSTLKYAEFADESKKIKLYLSDFLDGIETINSYKKIGKSIA